MIQVFHGRIPEAHPYSSAPVAVYHSMNDFVGSFRHALFDFILPVFNLLQLFRMYTPDFLLLEAQHQVRGVWNVALLLHYWAEMSWATVSLAGKERRCCWLGD